MRSFLTKYAAFLSPLIGNCALAACPEGFGIVGGSNDSGYPVAYFTESGGAFSNELLPALSPGSVNSVAMNGVGRGLIGGTSGVHGFAVYAFPDTSLSPQLLSGVSSIESVALNDAAVGLVGGTTGGNASAYLVYPNFTVSSQLLPATVGQVNSVAINNMNAALIGGKNSTDPIAFALFPNGTLSAQLLPAIGGETNSVALNSSGSGILGGIDGSANAFVYRVSASGGLSSQLLPVTSGAVTTVAINGSGIGLVGGDDGGTAPFAYLVASNGSLSAQLLPSIPIGEVLTVALNDSQVGLIGGNNGFNPMLFLLQPDGTLSPQLLPPLTGGAVNSVAINLFGAGLAAGDNGFTTFTYLISPTGEITAIYPSFNGQINSVAMIRALSQIPTRCLGGNNLTVANYINKYAPEKAFYFLPAFVDGTLSNALESVAPTRNAASLFTADNNLFLLNQYLSRHLRDQRHIDLYDWSGSSKDSSTAQLFASLDWPSGGGAANDSEQENSPVDDSRPYTLWTEVIGAFSYQKGEHQTPGFDPITGGFVLAMEAQLNSESSIGGGAAYTYTHIHQHRGSGYSHINQEYLFAYGLWGNRHFYIDSALWAGLFQIHQVRKIHMSGFDFRSTSDPRGCQISPHVEIGGDFYPGDAWVTIEPFAMWDWTNAWQRHYQEKGSGPFNMGQKNHYSSFLRTELGIRFYEAIAFPRWRLTFEEKAGYVNKKPFGVGTVNAFLVGSPGSFTVETLSTTQNLGVGEFAILFEPLDLHYPSGTIAYQGEFSIPYQSHQILLELSWDF
jgi:outer membrane autotransporter protein